MLVKILLGIVVAVALIIATGALVKIVRYGMKDTGNNSDEIGAILKKSLFLMTICWGIIVVCGMLIVLL